MIASISLLERDVSVSYCFLSTNISNMIYHNLAETFKAVFCIYKVAFGTYIHTYMYIHTYGCHCNKISLAFYFSKETNQAIREAHLKG